MTHRGGRGRRAPVASLIEISRVLEETARIVREHAEAECADGPALPLTAPQVRAIIAARWLRHEYLGFEATDAAWALLLELYAARLDGRRTTQTRLGGYAGIAPTTALQITRRFLATGIFTRHADPKNKRAIALDLSEDAARRIGAYLAAASDLAPFVA